MIVDQAPEETKTSELTSKEPKQQDNIPFWRVMLSVIQASIGVQNSKNKERDFTQGKLLPFIVAALLFTGCFILVVMLAVKLALSA
jgi:hypothetical protein